MTGSSRTRHAQRVRDPPRITGPRAAAASTSSTRDRPSTSGGTPPPAACWDCPDFMVITPGVACGERVPCMPGSPVTGR
ncbi:hypothetical protein O1M54_27380 [Streptomyces diastatochromogenes]|nr:hypothetical protein [Streptomyces diastatochromogenes]